MNGLQFHLDLIYFSNDILRLLVHNNLSKKGFCRTDRIKNEDIFGFGLNLGKAIIFFDQIADIDGMGRGQPEHQNYMRVFTGHSISVS